MSTTDHMNMSLPSRRHVDISPLEHQASGILEKYFLLKYSLPLEISLSPWGGDILFLWCDLSLNDKLWCDLSLPLWHQFPRRVFWNLSNGFGPWVTAQSNDKNVMLVEDKIHWVELDQKKHRISGKLFFLLWNRWHRVVCFGGTESFRLDRK